MVYPQGHMFESCILHKKNKMEGIEKHLKLLLAKREVLYKQGSNDEKLNDEIREFQKKIRESKFEKP